MVTHESDEPEFGPGFEEPIDDALAVGAAVDVVAKRDDGVLIGRLESIDEVVERI